MPERILPKASDLTEKITRGFSICSYCGALTAQSWTPQHRKSHPETSVQFYDVQFYDLFLLDGLTEPGIE